MKTSLLDLKEQYNSIKPEIDEAIRSVMESGQFILGPNVEFLEKEIAQYCNVKYGVGVANGTDALILALDAYGIGPGDEVITSPYTFFASAESISRVGATPIFVDVDPRTYNIDPAQIKSRITNKTKAIIPVHIFGQMADMDPIMDLAAKYKLIVIEDACQAIGATYKGKKAGSIGHSACFSFFPTKNLGGYGDGGMVVTNDGEIAEKIKVLRAHGGKKKYYHEILGYNSRLDELQAALLRVKLKKLDAWNDQRRAIANSYNELINNSKVIKPFEAEYGRSVYHLYVLQVDDREQFVLHMDRLNIATGVYYPVPLHQQRVYSSLVNQPIKLPVSEAIAPRGIAIPLYPDLKEEDVKRIIGAVNEW